MKKKTQAITSNPSQHSLKNGSAVADPTVLQSDGFLLVEQTVFRMCSSTPTGDDVTRTRALHATRCRSNEPSTDALQT
jgi:hypothetical protein